MDAPTLSLDGRRKHALNAVHREEEAMHGLLAVQIRARHLVVGRSGKAGKAGPSGPASRNFTARNNMRAMKKGDLGFFYHSGDEKAVVGIVEVVKEAHPDSTDDTGKWECVDIAAVKPLPKPVTLAAVKADKTLADMALVRCRASRCSR